MVVTLAVFLTLLVGVGLLWWWLFLTRDRLPEIEPPKYVEPHVHGPDCVHREPVERQHHIARAHVNRTMK